MLLIAACVLGPVAHPPPAWAATTITVTTFADELTNNSQCSLREAIRNANADAQIHQDCLAGSGADTIILPPIVTQAYSLTLSGTIDDDDATAGDLDITGNLTIQGAGSRPFTSPQTWIYAMPLDDRVFHVQSGAVVSISGLRVDRGNAGPGFGGGLLNSGGQVSLTDVWLTANEIDGAGGYAIHNAGQMTLNGVQVDFAYGGTGGAAIVTSGTLTVSNSTIIRGNASPTGASYGVRVNGGTTTLSNVTIADHGLAFSGNTGAGIFAGVGGTVNVNNATIADNHTGIQQSGGTITVRNTLIAANGPGTNCVGTVTSGGYNLSDDASCSGFTQPGDLPANTDARLISPTFPRDNGGRTDTIAVSPGSPALDAGNPATPLDGTGGRCAPTDQRGIARPIDGDGANGARCDIGAYELVRFQVDSTADEVDATPGNGVCATAAPVRCTLRAAVIETNALGGGLIALPSNPTPYTLTRAGIDNTGLAGDLDVTTGTAFIQGDGATSTIVDGGDLDRVFDLLGAIVEISDLTIRNGDTSSSSASENGGGIRTGADLTVRRSIITGNRSGEGGGMSTFSNRIAVVDSTIEGNVVTGRGGGIYMDRAISLTLTGSTVSGNQAGSDGGGVYLNETDATFTNVTVSNNQAVSEGGGLYLDGDDDNPTYQISSSTIAGNQASDNGGVDGPSDGSVILRNTIVANNTGGDCDPSNFTSNGYNLSSDTTCQFTNAANGDLQGLDPRLGPLADNGGPTRTHALLAGSPALDAANPAAPGSGSNACPTTDQRGQTRPREGDGIGLARCDMGAFELQTPYPADLSVALADAPDPVAVGQSLTYTATVTNNGPATATGVTVTDTLPAGVTFNSAGASQGNCLLHTNNGITTVICNLGVVPAGQAPTMTIGVTPTQTGPLSNSASATTSQTDSNPANNTATATTTVQSACAPRPNVRVTTSSGAPGQLNATIAAQTTVGTPTNSLSSVRFTRIDNAAVRLNGSPAAVGPAIPLPAGAQQATLLLTRQSPAQNPALATTVEFEVIDACGPWPSFVGGGPGAF